MFKRIILVSSMCLLLGSSCSPQVNNNTIEVLAKALYSKTHIGLLSSDRYIFTSMEIVEKGDNQGNGTPIKFKVEGIHLFKGLEEPPPGWKPQGFKVWIGENIDKEEPFSDTFIVYFQRDEFKKVRACSNGGFECVSENNLAELNANLEAAKQYRVEAQERTKQRQVEAEQKKKDDTLLMEKASKELQRRMEQEMDEHNRISQ